MAEMENLSKDVQLKQFLLSEIIKLSLPRKICIHVHVRRFYKHITVL